MCGNTCWLLDIVLENVSGEMIRKTKNDLWKYKTKSLFKNNKKEVTVIDFWHPSCIKNEECLYKKLVKSYNASISDEPEYIDEKNDVK